ncbi:MAG: TIM barrel protein [Planctomycetes bacterium]|nr:TIM barrel protein [Planctomycetota bacterium]
MPMTRRRFLAAAAAAATSSALIPSLAASAADGSSTMRLGLVTYLWGDDWDLPTLIKNCQTAGIHGLELRTQHKHAVEPSLSAAERLEVRRRFADSPVTLVGYGSNAEYHSANPAELQRNIELTRAYIKLMHDCGGTGVKVKPNGFVKDVPREKTIHQIGEALNVVGAFGADYGQKIRLEVHGSGTQELPHIKAIMDVATHPNVGVCWNCNNADLAGQGLEHNFHLIKDRLADTVHVRELNAGDYPYSQLIALLAASGFRDWILLECRTRPADRVQALAEQKSAFEKLVKGL